MASDTYKFTIPSKEFPVYANPNPIGVGSFGCAIRVGESEDTYSVVKTQLVGFDPYNRFNAPLANNEEYLSTTQLSELKDKVPFIVKLHNIFKFGYKDNQSLESLESILHRNDICKSTREKLTTVKNKWTEYLQEIETNNTALRPILDSLEQQALTDGLITEKQLQQLKKTIDDESNALKEVILFEDRLDQNQIAASGVSTRNSPQKSNPEKLKKYEDLKQRMKKEVPENQHPYDKNEEPAIVVMEMEYANGGDLDKRYTTQDPIDAAYVHSLLFQTLYAFYGINKNFLFIHNDIKPNNILVSLSASDRVLQLPDIGEYTIPANQPMFLLADYGLGKRKLFHRLTIWRNGTPIFTNPARLLYAAPHRPTVGTVSIPRTLDSDIWSLGLVAWITAACGLVTLPGATKPLKLPHLFYLVEVLGTKDRFKPKFQDLLNTILNEFYGKEFSTVAREDISVKRQEAAVAMVVSYWMKSMGHPFSPPEEITVNTKWNNSFTKTQNPTTLKMGKLGQLLRKYEAEIISVVDESAGVPQVFDKINEQMKLKLGEELFNIIKDMTTWIPVEQMHTEGQRALELLKLLQAHPVQAQMPWLKPDKKIEQPAIVVPSHHTNSQQEEPLPPVPEKAQSTQLVSENEHSKHSTQLVSEQEQSNHSTQLVSSDEEDNRHSSEPVYFDGTSDDLLYDTVPKFFRK